MVNEWSNWSGSLRFKAATFATPADEEELQNLVRRAGAEGRTVRVAGAGHSSTPLVRTSDILVFMERFKGVVCRDGDTMTIRSGMMLKEANQAFLEYGLALENLGDVDLQALVGAIGTGTHGTGKRLRIISNHLVGGRLINGKGEIVAFSLEEDPDLTLAARVALGTIGIFTELRLKLLPAFKLHRREWCTHIEVTLFYSDRDPVGPYKLTVPPRRVRRVRVNDLINPEAPPRTRNMARSSSPTFRLWSSSTVRTQAVRRTPF
jgi:FAD/FMN-containing dehydrogenase